MMRSMFLAVVLMASAIAKADLCDDVIRMLASGAGKDVILTYIEKSPSRPAITAVRVADLKAAGASDDIVLALMERQECPVEFVGLSSYGFWVRDVRIGWTWRPYCRGWSGLVVFRHGRWCRQPAGWTWVAPKATVTIGVRPAPGHVHGHVHGYWHRR